ncbi:MAG: hypothetical protein EP338_08835 [Bacteroidetes bacterium]|nr:MAG: hypothetical protein EP338_08835 [Bacteroidota bacterium]
MLKTSLLLLLVFWGGLLFGQPNMPYFQNFTNKVYGKKSNPEIYSILQDRENRILAGTSNGIKIYNGASWDFVGVKEASYVTALTRSEKDNIYVGALGDFGELRKKKNGSYYFKSFLDTIHLSEPVWRVYCLDEKVFFQTESKIYCFENGKLKFQLAPETSFHLSFKVGKKILVRQRDKGIYEVRNGKLVPFNASTRLKEYGVFAIFEHKGKFTYLTQDQQSEHEYEHSIYGGLQLKDGNYLIYTLQDGVYILDPNLKVQRHFTRLTGISDNDVKNAVQGSDGNIWLATNNGISFIEYESDISYYNENQGVIGDIQDAIRFEGKIYVASSKGVFVQGDQIFEASGHHLPTWEFLVHQGKLYCASSSGIYLLQNGEFRLLYPGNYNNLDFIQNRFYFAGPDGVRITNPQLNLLSAFEMPLNRTLRIYHEKRYNEVWIGTSSLGVVRINAQLQFDLFSDDENGGSLGWIKPLKGHNGRLIFGTMMGLQRFVYEDEMKKLLPDSLKNNPLFYRGCFEPRTQIEEISELFHFKGKRMAVVANEIRELKKFNILNSKYNYLDFGRINRVRTISGNAYICTSDGMIVMEKNARPIQSDFKLSLSKILAGEQHLDLEKGINISYSNNQLDFYFQAPFYLHGTKVNYRYQLEGEQDEWSAPIQDNHINFSKLMEGDYTIRIRAENSLNQHSNILTYSFSISPPWYRTWWAYALYISSIVVLFWFALNISKKRLKRRNEELENIVRERTKEIAEQKELIEEKHLEITDSINYAERIQAAMMTNRAQWEKISPEHLIFFRPRDIVSGDFYWAFQNERYSIWVAADCTGHGVPGAFMSMLGIGFLNEIVMEGGIHEPAEILNLLRSKIVQALEQREEGNERKDGMDIALCCLDKRTNKLKYAGANNPLLFLTRNQEKAEAIGDRKMLNHDNYYLSAISADKMPVGKYVDNELPFTQKEIELEEGDICFTFSDGFPDQFGGYDGKKYMIKRFKRLLIKNAELSMQEQYEQMERTFDKWLADGNASQIDDVCVVGIKF